MRKYEMNNVELSKALHVSESTVGKWLLKKSIPRMGIIEKISILFHIAKSDLIEDKNANAPLHANERNIQADLAAILEAVSSYPEPSSDLEIFKSTVNSAVLQSDRLPLKTYVPKKKDE